MIIMFSALNMHSQTLNNTQWNVYDTYNKFYICFSFYDDTLSDCQNNNFLSYKVTGNNFSMNELPFVNICGQSDTGKYTFLIYNDTLKFTLIKDLCSKRTTTFEKYHWVALHNSNEINILNQLPSDISVYPNPTGDVITICSNSIRSIYIITDQTGRQVMSGTLNAERTSVDIRNLVAGIYFIQIEKNKYQTLKILKK